MPPDPAVRIAVLGASGLIGHALTLDLQRFHHTVVAVARRFTPAQRAAHRVPAEQLALVQLDQDKLAAALEGFDIVVNCLGVLQDAPGSSTEDVHVGFVTRLLAAMPRGCVLIHISVPQSGQDVTDFSRSKRAAEAAIRAGTSPYLILRPGFVLSDAAFGGSALMRALAALPVSLPSALAATPFAVTDAADIAATVAFAAGSSAVARRSFAATWNVFSDESATVGSVLRALQCRLGGQHARLPLPSWLLHLGAWAGDLASLAGWVPPVRSTALAELARGLAGDPAPWRKTTGILPRTIANILATRPATVQEQWFGRLFLLKPLIFGSLSLFWVVSGLIALFPAFGPAVEILVRHGVRPDIAFPFAVATSLADIAIGVGIALRRTTRPALTVGLLVSAAYLLGAAALAPELWLDPVGSMVKTIPVMILMLVALAIADNR